jgi:hypothetical protein
LSCASDWPRTPERLDDQSRNIIPEAGKRIPSLSRARQAGAERKREREREREREKREKEREPVSQSVRVFYSVDHPQRAAREYGAPPGGGNQGCGVRGGVKKGWPAQDSNLESPAPGADALSSCARPSQVKLHEISGCATLDLISRSPIEGEPVSQSVRFFSADHPQVAARVYGAPPGGGNQGCGVRGGVKKR